MILSLLWTKLRSFQDNAILATVLKYVEQPLRCLLMTFLGYSLHHDCIQLLGGCRLVRERVLDHHVSRAKQNRFYTSRTVGMLTRSRQMRLPASYRQDIPALLAQMGISIVPGCFRAWESNMCHITVLSCSDNWPSHCRYWCCRPFLRGFGDHCTLHSYATTSKSVHS